MSHQKKSRNAFRPTSGDVSLEERVVLSQISAFNALTPAPARNPTSDTLTVRQLRNAYATQTHLAFQNLNQAIKQEVKQLYANGKPTSRQLTDFNAAVGGMVDATAFRLASQQALLPGGGHRQSLTGFQNALLSTNKGSLLSRIQAITSSNRLTNSAGALQNAITSRIASLSTNGATQLSNSFNNTNIAAASVDQNGQRIPLRQFLGQQIMTQFGNTLGALAQSFPNLANSTLFANGVTNPSTSTLQTFQNQTNQGLNLAAFQLGNNLSLINGATTTLLPDLQSGFFGTTGSTATGSFNGLSNGLQNLPFSGGFNNDFTQGVTNTFNTGFGNLTSSLNGFFGMPSQMNVTVPTDPTSSVFAPTFTNSNAFSGFNSGFGSGFPGFGTAPTSGFNSNFGNGFNNTINTGTTNFGFAVPSILLTPGGGNFPGGTPN